MAEKSVGMCVRPGHKRGPCGGEDEEDSISPVSKR